MGDMNCEEIRDLLVDLTDDELDESQADRVELHLSRCPACRSEKLRLGHSLAIARGIWQDLASESVVSTSRVPTRRAIGYVTGFAAAGLLIAVSIWQFAIRTEDQRVGVVQEPQTVVPMDNAQIERAVRREERAARLAASMNILVDQQGLEREGSQAKKDLIARYSDTLVARELSK